MFYLKHSIFLNKKNQKVVDFYSFVSFNIKNSFLYFYNLRILKKYFYLNSSLYSIKNLLRLGNFKILNVSFYKNLKKIKDNFKKTSLKILKQKKNLKIYLKK